MRGRVSTCALSATLLLSASVGAQSTGSFPPVGGGGGAPPPSGSSYPPPSGGQYPPAPPPSGSTSPPPGSYPPPSPGGSPSQPAPPPSTGSYPSGPGAGSSSPPSTGSYPSGPGAYPPPPSASTPRYPSSPPPSAPGQVLGAYQRPRDATMPGYGDSGAPRRVMRVERHDYRHDGFYLRLAFDIGLATGSLSTDAPIQTERNLPGAYRPTPFSGSMSGVAPGTQVAVGFTPLPGFAVGVGIDTASIIHGQASTGNPQTGDYVFRTSQLALFTALADWYFDPEAGFHAQGGLGLATYVAGVGEPKNVGPRADAYTAIGFGFHLGVGWEAFVTRQWSLGVLGRLLYGSMSGSDPVGAYWSNSMLVPGLSLTGTYH